MSNKERLDQAALVEPQHPAAGWDASVACSNKIPPMILVRNMVEEGCMHEYACVPSVHRIIARL